MTALAELPRDSGASARRALAVWSRHGTPATWFLILAIPFGLAILALLPPSQGFDELNHFYRVYSITDGHLVAVHRDGRWGAEIPACVYGYLGRIYTQAITPGSSIASRNFLSTPPGCGSAPARFRAFENSALYSPMSYAPQVVGVWLTRSVSLPIPIQFYAGRVLGLLTFILIVYLALRIAPRGGLVLLVVATLPASLVQASGYSADGMTIALGLLSTALVIRSVAKEDAGIRTFAALGTALVALGLCKSTYFLLAPLVLLVPGRVFPSRTWEAAGKAAVLIAVALVSYAWYEQVRDISLAPWRPGDLISPKLQLSLILHHPGWYAGILLRSWVVPGQSSWLQGFVSEFGFFRTLTAGGGAPPLVVILTGFFILFLAYQAEIGRRHAAAVGSYLKALLPLALVVAIWVASFTALYLAWEPVGYPNLSVYGGRYLLPIAAVPAISACLVWRSRQPRPLPLRWVPFIAALLVYAVWKEVTFYY